MEQTTKYVGVDGGEYLLHFGILGMKWGVRRFQNPDGTLTEAGKRRYYKDWQSARNSAHIFDSEKRNTADKKYFGEQYHVAQDKELAKAKRGRQDALDYALRREKEYNKLSEDIIDEAYANAKTAREKIQKPSYVTDEDWDAVLEEQEELKLREKYASQLQEKAASANNAWNDYNKAYKYLDSVLDKRISDYAPSNLSKGDKIRLKSALRELEDMYEEWN